MKQGETNKQQLQEMLHALPEREVPVGLTERIMTEINSPKKSLKQRITNLLTTSFTFNVQPLRLTAFCGTMFLVFWLGITIGEYGTDTNDAPKGGVKPLAIPPHSAEANFLIGRGLLAAGQWEEAMPYLHQATLLVPDNPEYALWEGVALGKKGNMKMERDIYRKTVHRHPEYVPARMYLGHNLLESGQPEAALEEYSRVLTLFPAAESALYNRALAYQVMGNRELEAAAWKEYLLLNRIGKWAYRAVEHLNTLGDFTYRSYQIGLRKIILNQKLLLRSDSEAQQREIDLLSTTFAQASGNVLNLVVFLADDITRAEKQARKMQYLVANNLNNRTEKRIDISWFGEPENVRTAFGKEYLLEEGVLIFCIPQVQKTREKTI